MIEYTFAFECEIPNLRPTAVFVANNDTEAFNIAKNYMEDVLENRFDVAEIVHRKQLNIWD
jgi:hypothetical protein